MERGETRALVGWDGKEIWPHISQASMSFQSVGSLLGCQVKAPTTLCWDVGTGLPGTIVTAPHDWVLPRPEEFLAQPGVQKVLA